MSETSQFAHHTIALEGVTLHYVTVGSGDPLVLLHGWPKLGTNGAV
jgi:pimeloyl-ACP methyl ester carboxylesterase